MFDCNSVYYEESQDNHTKVLYFKSKSNIILRRIITLGITPNYNAFIIEIHHTFCTVAFHNIHLKCEISKE